MSTRHRRRPARRAAKTLLCVVLALAVLVSPWESGLLPAPVRDLAGAHAAAQTPPPEPEDPESEYPGNLNPCVTNPARLVFMSMSLCSPGTPNPCLTDPAPWTPQADDPGYSTSSECVLELPACPQSPLDPPGTTTFMRLSSPPPGLAERFWPLPVVYPDVEGLKRYPDFCEVRVLASSPEYAKCLVETGYVRSEYTDTDAEEGQDGCRLLHPIKCPVGLYMTTSSTCRAVQRRTWVCPAEHVPRNEFNTCYRLQATAPHPHPACGEGSESGSPDFGAMSCEDYVGDDFIANPALVDCTAAYVTGTPVEHPAGTIVFADAPEVRMQQNYRDGIASDHWCSYDTRFLDTVCHRTDISRPRCTSPASMALCIKRASQTGGCDAVANTIRCRAHEAAWRQQRAVPLEEVRLKGCTPCVILPFAHDPGRFGHINRCPPDTHRPPRSGRTGSSEDPRLVVIHREEADFAIIAAACERVHLHKESLQDHSDCAMLAVCADPPRGAVAWEPTHVSGVAVVNAPVIVTVTDIRLRESDWRGHVYPRSPHLDVVVFSEERRWVTYDGDIGGDPRVRTWKSIESSATFASVDQITGGERVKECEVSQAPRFKMVVQELWPDNGPTMYQSDCSVLPADRRPGSDAEAIIELFGTDSLDWWCKLSDAERRRHTAARGLAWWDDDPATEQAKRVKDLTEKVDCEYTTNGQTIWCRWVPTRPGYYRLTAAGAWYMSSYDRAPAGGLLTEMLAYLNDPTHGTDRREQMSAELASVGRDAANIGLSGDLLGDNLMTALRPPYPEPDWIYSDEALLTNCPSIDLRIYCHFSASGNYTESEPIGIMVHEVRVSTVTPSR